MHERVETIKTINMYNDKFVTENIRLWHEIDVSAKMPDLHNPSSESRSQIIIRTFFLQLHVAKEVKCMSVCKTHQQSKRKWKN